MEFRYDTFLRLCNMILGGMAGFLIALPGAATMSTHSLGGVIVVFGTVLGVAVGRRRGASRAFLYFSLAAVLVLAGVVSRGLFSE